MIFTILKNSQGINKITLTGKWSPEIKGVNEEKKNSVKVKKGSA